jgi:hypothetical protein
MWSIKQRRTKPRTVGNKVIYPKLNATAKPNRYVNRNTYLDVKCNKDKGAGCTIVGCQCSTDASGNTYCCKTAPYRNPILGYREHLVDCSATDLGCRLPINDVSGNVYKDNYAKSCGDPANSLVCYNPVIKKTQNRNGCVNESYNYSTNQYLTRRCLTFPQQEFNFQSQVPVDASGCCTKFRSCANCQYGSSGVCNCSINGFCTPCGHSQACIGINKLPCEVKNTKCFAIYKRSNPKFNRQGAVSGGSRINRLKYQTRIVAQGRKVNGINNVINRRGPAANYMTSRPLTMNAPGCWLNKDRTRSGLAQRCIMNDPTSGPVVTCTVIGVSDVISHVSYFVTDHHTYATINASWVIPSQWFNPPECGTMLHLLIKLFKNGIFVGTSEEILHDTYIHTPRPLAVVSPDDSIYQILVETQSIGGGEDKKAYSSPFQILPLPPPLDCSDPGDDCSVSSNWVGTITTHPMNGTGTNWGLRVVHGGHIPYIDCVKQWNITLLDSNKHALNPAFPTLIRTPAQGFPSTISIHQECETPCSGTNCCIAYEGLSQNTHYYVRIVTDVSGTSCPNQQVEYPGMTGHDPDPPATCTVNRVMDVSSLVHYTNDNTHATINAKWTNPSQWFDPPGCGTMNYLNVYIKENTAPPFASQQVNPNSEHTTTTLATVHPSNTITYQICVETNATSSVKIENKTRCSTPFKVPPKPPPLDCSNPGDGCSTATNWVGTNTTSKINGTNWGLQVHHNGIIPYINCVKQWNITLLDSDKHALNPVFPTLIRTPAQGFPTWISIHQKCDDAACSETDCCIAYEDLSQNTQYYVQIKTDVSGNSTCSTPRLFDILGVTGKNNPNPPPPTPPPKDSPQWYVTMYGQGSYKPLSDKGIWGIIPFAGQVAQHVPPTTLEYKENAWGLLRRWSTNLSNKYIDFIMQNPEVQNIQWHFGDYLTILPPQGPTQIPNDPKFNPSKYFLSSSDQYTAINGPIDFGLSYNSRTILSKLAGGGPRWPMERNATSNYENNSGDPILIGNAFILDFLIPLAKTCFTSKSKRAPPQITFAVYPKVANAKLSLDVGNYGNKDDSRRITIDKHTNKAAPNGFATKYYTDSVDVSSGNDLFAHPAVPPPFGNLPSSPKTPMWWQDGGNNLIGNGTGHGTGRSAYYYPPVGGNGDSVPTLQKVLGDGFGGTFTNINTNEQGYPLDNLHQYFIIIYKMNQKIMELNTTCPDFESMKIPLITHVHYDSEGGSDYTPATSVGGGNYPRGDGIASASGVGADVGTGELLPSAAPAHTGGLGATLGQGYQKYLYNKYMPAECLPEWRTNPNISNGMHPNYGCVVPNFYDHVRDCSEVLWDNSKPWNVDQQRNFSLDATGTGIGAIGNNKGFANSSNDFSSRALGSAYDGIQRYQYGYIAYQVPTGMNPNAQGIIQGFNENYNVGENQPPAVFAIDKHNKPWEFPPPENGKIDPAHYNATHSVALDAGGTGLPVVDTGHIIANETNSLGSGVITGNFCPGCPNYSGDPPKIQYYMCNEGCTADPNICTSNTWKLNCITRPLHARIWDAYIQPIINNPAATLTVSDFIGNNQVTEDQSPAFLDIYQRYDMIKYDTAVYADTRGIKKNNIGIHPTSVKDGFYCPIDPSFVNLSTGVINLSGLGPNFTDTSSMVNNHPVANNFGPQGSVFTVQTCLKGATLTLDPRLPGPPLPGHWPGGNKGNPDGSLFTVQDQCTNTWVFGKMMDEPMNIYWPRSDRQEFDKKSSPYRIKDPSGGWNNSTYIINEKPGNCWTTIGSDGGASGPYGDNTNALGVLQDWKAKEHGSNPHGTRYFKLFAQALGTVMCGPENIDKAKVGLYSIEFLPLNWFTPAH